MDKSLIVIVIPGTNVRELFPETLGDFGSSPTREKDIAGFYLNKIECPPISPNPDFILISENELRATHFKQLREIFLQYDKLYITHHESSNFAANFSLDTVGTQNQMCCVSFHREPETDKVYQRILALFECATQKKSEDSLMGAKKNLIGIFPIDWELESKIKKRHDKLECPESIQISKGTLVLWNENDLSHKLTRVLGKESVATSESEFQYKLNGKNNLVVLSELNWNNRNLSRFYGYQFINNLVTQNQEFDVAFVSCIDRERIKPINRYTRLLAPIFPHFKLPFVKDAPTKIDVPHISSTKWSVIRSYYTRPDGIVDKLLHDLKKITEFTPKEKIENVLQNILSYTSVLDSPLVKQTENIQALLKDNADYLGLEIQKLQTMLDDFYLKGLEPENKEPYALKSPFQIMVVEDEATTLNILRNGISTYFNEVATFTSGEEAFKNLVKNHRSYSAIIVDMELLDEQGNWQEIQGADLIEQAKQYPHLVIYMITAYSKRALTNIQGKINLGEVNYISKDATNGLPPELSYQKFAQKLDSEIKKKQKFLDGPKLGLWKKGLLYFYYQVMQKKDGEKLWADVTEAVNRFLEGGEKNEDQFIPSKLFHVATKEFDLDKLKTILIHRLVNLFYQYREGSVNFKSHIREVLGLQIKNAKQYYNSLLGLSAVSENSDGQTSKVFIQKKGLFPEEILWLRAIIPDTPSLQFPKLYDAMTDAVYYLPPQVKQQNHKLLSSIETLSDCLSIMKIFIKSPDKSREEIAVDLSDYKKNYQNEYLQLKHEKEGEKIAELIDEFN